MENLCALGIMDKTAPTSGTKGKISFELKEMLSVRYFSLGRLFKCRVAYKSFLRLLQNPLCLKFNNMLWVELGLKSAHVYFTLLATSFSCGLLKTHSFHWRALGSLLTERRSWRAHWGRSDKGGIAIISLKFFAARFASGSRDLSRHIYRTLFLRSSTLSLLKTN